MAIYKATGQAPKTDTAKGEEDHDPAASQLQKDFAGAEAEAEETEDSTSSSEEEEESPSPPVVKEKTPPRSGAKKSRRSETKAKEVETPAKSPVKRGRKATVAEPASVAKTPAETKRKTKKRKSEA